MPQWTIDRPERLTFGRVASLDVRIVAGRLAVLASDGPPTLEVTELEGSSPLLVAYDEENERLTVTYKDLTWDGMIGWLRKDKRRTVLSITVPKNCSISAGVVTASAVVSGFENSTQAKSVSGEIVFDGVSGEVNATTVSGDVESRAMVQALGIDVRKAFTLVFAIGGIAAAIAGVLSGVYFNDVSPEQGTSLLIFAFIVVVIGGLGSIGGSAAAAVIVGLVQQYTNYYASAGVGDMIVVLLLGIVLLTRPRGIAGAVVGARA